MDFPYRLVDTRRTVCWPLVGWLCLGSVPSAFLGVLLLRLVGPEGNLQRAVQYAMGAALLLAVAGLITRAYGRRRFASTEDWTATVRVRRLPTVALGAVGGLP